MNLFSGGRLEIRQAGGKLILDTLVDGGHPIALQQHVSGPRELFSSTTFFCFWGKPGSNRTPALRAMPEEVREGTPALRTKPEESCSPTNSHAGRPLR